jgi:hypothetical protein
MIKWFKNLFFKKKYKKDYVYIVMYYDFATGKFHQSKHFSDYKFDRKNDVIYGGFLTTVRLLFVFEDDKLEEDTEK